jgi:predicted nucleic acid-binding protein
MVLVDTSVWIRFLAGKQPFAGRLQKLLGLEDVAGHELIYGELLIGDRGGRGTLLNAYELMTQAQSVRHEEVVAFVRDRGLHGRGAGWIDVHLLASALVERMWFWTADPRLEALAAELGIAYIRAPSQ